MKKTKKTQKGGLKLTAEQVEKLSEKAICHAIRLPDGTWKMLPTGPQNKRVH